MKTFRIHYQFTKGNSFRGTYSCENFEIVERDTKDEAIEFVEDAWGSMKGFQITKVIEIA